MEICIILTGLNITLIRSGFLLCIVVFISVLCFTYVHGIFVSYAATMRMNHSMQRLCTLLCLERGVNKQLVSAASHFSFSAQTFRFCTERNFSDYSHLAAWQLILLQTCWVQSSNERADYLSSNKLSRQKRNSEEWFINLSRQVGF